MLHSRFQVNHLMRHDQYESLKGLANGTAYPNAMPPVDEKIVAVPIRRPQNAELDIIRGRKFPTTKWGRCQEQFINPLDHDRRNMH